MFVCILFLEAFVSGSSLFDVDSLQLITKTNMQKANWDKEL